MWKRICLAIFAVICSGCAATWSIETTMIDGKIKTVFTQTAEVEPEKAVAAVTDMVTGMVTPG